MLRLAVCVMLLESLEEQAKFELESFPAAMPRLVIFPQRISLTIARVMTRSLLNKKVRDG